MALTIDGSTRLRRSLVRWVPVEWDARSPAGLPTSPAAAR